MSVEDLFISEILKWRYASALGAVLLIQAILPFLFCGSFKTLFILQIWHPLSLLQHLWLSPWFSGLLWPSVCYLILVRLHVHNYTVVEDHCTKVWHVGRKALRLHSMGVVLVQVVCLCYLAQLYAAAAHPHFSHLLLSCQDSSDASHGGTCVNSHALLVLCLGAYCGLRYAVSYVLGGGNLVTMATMSVPKKQKLRSLFSPSALGKRLMAAFWGDGENERHVKGVGIRGVIALVILYALFGGILELWVGSALGVAVPSNVAAALAVSDQESHVDRTSSPPQVNATEDLYKLNQAQSWVTAVAAWQRLQVVADPVLLLVLSLVMVVLTVMLQLFHDLFTLFVMQPISLPVPAAQDEMWSLSLALQSQHPVLQLLGCHRLCLLGTAGGPSGYAARQPAFAISSPGGHPRNWQSILKPSLALISGFTERLVKNNCPEELSSLVPSASSPANTSILASANTSVMGNKIGNTSLLGTKTEHDSLLGNPFGNVSIMSGKAGNTSFGNPTSNTSLIGNHMSNTSILANIDNTSMIRNAIFNSSVYGNTSMMRNAAGNVTIASNAIGHQQKNAMMIGQQPDDALAKKPSVLVIFKTKVISWLKERVSSLRRLPVVRTLLADLPDAANQQAFAAALPVMWAVQGLCGLVTASYTEDRYGVVQKDLHTLLATLLNLNLVLDKVGRAPLPKLCSGGGGVAVVGGRAGVAQHHLRLRRALRLALRTALYRLVHTFRDSVLEIQLSSTHRSKVQSYLDMMEG